jgi:hypothetical protein
MRWERCHPGGPAFKGRSATRTTTGDEELAIRILRVQAD